MRTSDILGAVILVSMTGCSPPAAGVAVIIIPKSAPPPGEPPVLAVAASPSRRWVPASDGKVPPEAPPAGVEQPPGDEPLWACRAHYAGPGRRPGVHPGKVAPHLGGCRIGYGRAEVGVRSYEVLVDAAQWVPAEGDMLPRGALQAGVEGPDDGGQPLYLCRAHYPEGTTGLHIGKARPGFGGCNIGWGQREITIGSYEVAVGR